MTALPIKHLLESAAARSGAAAALTRRRVPSTAVLGYHNVVPVGETAVGDLALHVGQARFADQLDLLLETHDVVSLRDVVFGEEGGRRPRVVITFDDAYVGTVTVGFDELRKRGLPATVFVPPGLLGADGFWWDRLAPDGGQPLDPAVRDMAQGADLQGRQDRVLAWAAAEGVALADLPPYARPATEAELLARTRDTPGVTLGAHTWSHPNLSVLDPSDAREEMRRSREWLEACGADVVDWLAYPYGLLTPAVAGIATELFEGAFLVEGGMAQIKRTWYGDPPRVPRLQVPSGLSVDGLAIRLAGVLRGHLAGTSTS